MTTELLRCKVAKVLSNSEIVITAGSQLGVEEGMKFEVVGEVLIKDPDSSSILERIQVTKARVEVVRVGERVSIASTYRRTSIKLDVGHRLLSPREQIVSKQVEQDDDWNKVVGVGDEVVQVVEPTQIADEAGGRTAAWSTIGL